MIGITEAISRSPACTICFDMDSLCFVPSLVLRIY